ncbi:putative zinc transporter protein ZnuB [Anaplasma centrale str. Israel]|uniref:High-affinity zinc uptake system membrane protein ZnuB n=1 Tax=Anaplasma centrale (strain Israel) TaxID=574556 RepID=D1AUC9_ANACI|nr:metal ABC transporter permease [Anaplasma centrale]ACZ49157.1 putative zinc transporter protein ZnuB [Anaplasma centrale str. Israel]
MSNIIFEDFFINGILAILTASLITAPLGSVMIWNRLSYMGDSIAHSSLLGVGIALLLEVHMSLGVFVVAILLALIISLAMDRIHAIDTILNIMTSVVMSLSMILLSLVPSSGERVIHSLFGDVLMVGKSDLFEMAVIAIIGIVVLVWRWRYWVAVSVSRDLSLSAGIRAGQIKTEILVVSALVIVLFSRSVGILLITSFLTIPASGAKLISKTPVQMVIISVVISAVSGILGLLCAAKFDTFPGPMIIISSFAMLLLTHLLKK